MIVYINCCFPLVYVCLASYVPFLPKKRNIYRDIMKRALYILFIMVLTAKSFPLFSQNFQEAETFVFSFPENEDRLFADYGENAVELLRMIKSLQESRVALLEGTSHLLIVAHLESWQYMETDAVNEASIRADRLRKYIKTKLKLPYESMAFYIDRSGLNCEEVHVYYLKTPLRWFANQEICYSESHYPKSMEVAIGKYGAIPFVEQYKRASSDRGDRIIYVISDALFEREELDDYRLLIRKNTDVSFVTKNKNEKKEESSLSDSKPDEKRVREIHTVIPDGFYGACPFNLSVKTNLLPWCTLVPSILLGNGPVEFNRGSFMPNLELEYCFGRRWSVDASFLYSYFTYGSDQDNLWGVSSLTLEPRFWLRGDGRFRWLWVGAFGQYGDFDVRGEKISATGLYGRTGKFASGGLSVGCMIPLGAGFCVEAALQGGYRSVFGGEKYRYDKADDKNYQESLFTATGMMVGFRLSIVYRMGIR